MCRSLIYHFERLLVHCTQKLSTLKACMLKKKNQEINMLARFYRPTLPRRVSVLGLAVAVCTETMASLILVCSSLQNKIVQLRSKLG